METPPLPTEGKGRPIWRPLWLLAGLALTGLGIAGYILPVMPGTVFLILAAGCFARSSPRLEAWLMNHPKYGPSLRAWQERGAIPLKAKILAVSMMFVSMAVVCLSPAPHWVDWATAVALVGSAIFVITRPGVPKPAA